MLQLKKLLDEIHRRSLWQVLLVYAGAAWVVLAGVDTLAGALGLPEWAPRFALFLLLIGLPVVLATAVIQEGVGTDGTDTSGIESRETPSRTGSRRRLFTWRNAVLGGLGAGLLWGGVAIGWFVFGRGPVQPEVVADGLEPAIAVLPFDVNDPALDDLREGVPLLLATTLRSAAGVRPVAANTVLSTWDRRVERGRRADLDEALRIARSSGGSHALIGSAVVLGSGLRLAGELFDARSGEALGPVQTEGARDSVWTLVDGLAVEVVKKLVAEGVGSISGFDVRAVTTRSLPALMAYLEGESRYRRGDFLGALEPLETGISEDSTFALAHYRLGQAYSWFGRREESAFHLERARAGSLPAREVLFSRMTVATSKRSAEPLQDLQAFVRRHPEDAEAWNALGEVWLHAGILVGRDWLKEARATLERAVEIEPGRGLYLLHALQLALIAADTAHGWDLIERYGAVHPGSAEDRAHRALWHYEFGGVEPPVSLAAALDALGSHYGNNLIYYTRSPELLEAHLRSDEAQGSVRAELCIVVPLRSGDWQKLLAYATSEAIPVRSRFLCLFQVAASGLPVPEPLLEEAARAALADDRGAALRQGAHLLGARLSDRARWAEVESLRTELAERLAEASSRADSAVIDSLHFQLRSVEGYAQWKRGSPEEAARTLEALRPIWWSEHRWWLGQIYLELGRLDDAARWLTGLPVGAESVAWPHAASLLGRIHEDLEELEAAAAVYRDFIDRWKDADPELRPRVEAVRERLAEIVTEPR